MKKKRPKYTSLAISSTNVYKYLQLEAIESILTDSLGYFERKVRRWYSKAFHTALHEVYKLPWDFVLRNYYESSLENQGYNEVFDIAVNHYIPEMADLQLEKDREFDRVLVRKQTKQIIEKKKRDQTKEAEKSQSLKDQDQKAVKKRPKRVKPVTDLKASFDMDDPDKSPDDE